MRTIVNEASLYDQLKLLAAFAREAGYKGVVVSLDELVNLYKPVSSQARQSDYEQIIRILNDVLRGTAQHTGFLKGGAPEFLMDTRRGLYSHAARQSRLAGNSFARDGRILEDDLWRSKRKRQTAKRALERLRDGYGFDGGFTMVKDHAGGIAARPVRQEEKTGQRDGRMVRKAKLPRSSLVYPRGRGASSALSRLRLRHP